jgi:hypothetical protein
MDNMRVEECVPLRLDALPDRSHTSWDLSLMVTIEWAVDGPMAGEPTRLQMTVRRRHNKLIVELAKFGSSRLFLRQSVLIFPGGPRGYREYLICDGCGARVRQLLLPAMAMDAYTFRCRACHDLKYESQFRQRRLTFCGLGRPRKNRSKSGRKPGRPKTKRTYQRRTYDKKVIAGDEAYCLKCKEPRRIAQPFLTVFSNGRPAVKGACPVCDTRLSKARAWAN